ncbi:peptide chain release factor N(5)-glutamine methyltransferase [Stappia sp. GBMRC 2046]|uniref:Release factor glutamine methyltransferase n=1 Tax=Stappia sediminis TaxID=2692190 RepID=A0A7X3LU58_9HYPH|nr:peptide chain release factor N(5)-glutamine methyltransferase [Stappia sediminis]
MRAAFRAAALSTPDLDARVLTAHATDREPNEVVLKGEEPVGERMRECALSLANDRLAGKPVARILGRKEFWGLTFTLSDETLEPRPDTELLVEQVLECCGDRSAELTILDIGTGSGAIAVSLLHELPRAIAIGTDLSQGALLAARANACRNGVGERFFPVACDGHSAISGDFDFLVSNPPYIRSMDITTLDVGVRQHDPVLALDGGADGLAAYRSIARDSRHLLRRGGYVFFEIGYDQAAEVAAISVESGYENISVFQDLAGHDRVIRGFRAT